MISSCRERRDCDEHAACATREEAVEGFRSALRFHLESMRQEGLPVPDVRELEVRELIAA